MPALIRHFDADNDLDGLRRCFIELQDFERAYDSRMPAGAGIADECIVRILDRCKREDGQVIVAEVDGVLAGYVSAFARVRSEVLHDGSFEYALIGDLVVLEAYRGGGLGKKLLRAAEDFVKERGAQWLRIGVVSGNQRAINLYESMGYGSIYTELEKTL